VDPTAAAVAARLEHAGREPAVLAMPRIGGLHGVTQAIGGLNFNCGTIAILVEHPSATDEVETT
jgi:hypothetical protein